jgi:hypothetical protein
MIQQQNSACPCADSISFVQLTVEQIAAEKAALKTRLESINTWFEQVAGRSLHKYVRMRCFVPPSYMTAVVESDACVTLCSVMLGRSML